MKKKGAVARARRGTKGTKPGRGQRGRGRPTTRPLAPRINATPEQLVEAMFRSPPNPRWRYLEEGGIEYRCVICKREVSFPEVLYDDDRCEECHTEE